MADIVLAPLLQVVFDRIASPIIQKCGELWELEDTFKNLQQALLMAQAVLEDAEAQQITNKAVKVWLSELKDAIYDAEDVLDRALALSVLKEENSADLKLMAEALFSVFANEVKTTLLKLEATAMLGSNFNLRQANLAVVQSNERETISCVTEPEIYGRDADKENIIKLLLSKEENESFIWIIGVGGIGKTTLAQLAFNDDKVTQHFDVKVWVFAAGDFDVNQIMKAIIESVTMDKCPALPKEVLWLKMRKLLEKKRSLVVLDDVWAEDADVEKLEQLSKILKGSKVLITSRNKKVASIMSSPIFRYYLKGLAEDDCWKLFKSRAFTKQDEEKYPNLQQIGKVIIQKCGGIPLAAKQLGSSLFFKREESEWLYVQNSEIWNLDVGILPALRLSYLHLPYHLKRCFEFCSIFPKKYEINKERLIQMWMAQGLIQQSNGSSKQLEDIGDEYFQQLVWASFFEDAGVTENDGSRIYKMHDVMHDLALSISGDEYLAIESGLPSSNLSRTRHLNVILEFNTSNILEAVCRAHHLRTLIGIDSSELPSELAEYFPFLRFLDLTASGTLQDLRFHEFLCLRYLDLSYTDITFGQSIENIPFLQTLNLGHCSNLRNLPNVRNMAHLRHLNITACEKLTSMLSSDVNIVYRSLSNVRYVESISNMCLPKQHNQIQTLSTVIVDSFLDLMFLGVINLRGELTIKGLQNINSSAEAQRANLIKKDKLELLELHWEDKVEKIWHVVAERKRRHAFRFNSFIQPSPYQRGEQQHSLGSSWWQPTASLSSQSAYSTSYRRQPTASVSSQPAYSTSYWRQPTASVSTQPAYSASSRRQPTSSVSSQPADSVSSRRQPPVSMFSRRQPPVSMSSQPADSVFSQGQPAVSRTHRMQSAVSRLQTEADLAESIMSDLHPHKNLKILVVQGYPGRKFPHWKLPNLIEVNLTLCKSCQRLPILGNLLSLKNIYLKEFPAVTNIGNEFYGENNQRPFPSLHELVIENFANLQDWVDVDGGDAFPNLTKLIVKKCPKLTSIPRFSSLQHLELRNCNGALFDSIRGQNSLTTLVIEKVSKLFSLPEALFSKNSLLTSLDIISCPDLRCLPPQLVTLTVLKSLRIRWCDELSFLPQGLHNLKALELLEITDCHSLTSMPEDGIGSLSSLRSLSIENCSNLTSISESFQSLSCLEHLTVMYCPSLVSFPEDMNHLFALRSLTIISCPKISSLPEGLQNVTTLLVLEISGCPGLKVLPEWIGKMESLRSLIICDCGGLTQLPEDLKLLTGLQHLSIQECREIEERCKADGEDWPKIAHVPHKYIGVSAPSQSGEASSSFT